MWLHVNVVWTAMMQWLVKKSHLPGQVVSLFPSLPPSVCFFIVCICLHDLYGTVRVFIGNFIGWYQVMLVFMHMLNHAQHLRKHSSEVSVARCRPWNRQNSERPVSYIMHFTNSQVVTFHVIWRKIVYLWLPTGCPKMLTLFGSWVW